MKIPAFAWEQIYPRVFNRVLEVGLPDGFGVAKRAIEDELSPSEIQEAARSLQAYLEQIAVNLSPLATEEFYLVLQLAEEACLFEGMGFLPDDKMRFAFERLLKTLLAPRSGWFKDEMTKDRRAQFSEFWPFPDLLRDCR